jgi:hypothetical protein
VEEERGRRGGADDNEVRREVREYHRIRRELFAKFLPEIS